MKEETKRALRHLDAVAAEVPGQLGKRVRFYLAKFRALLDVAQPEGESE